MPTESFLQVACWNHGMLGGAGEVFDFKFPAYTLASCCASGWRWFAVSAPGWICSAGRQQTLLKLSFFSLISGLLPGVKSFPYLCHLEQRVSVIVSPADPKSSFCCTGSIQQHLVIITLFPVLTRHCFSCSSEWGITFTARLQSVLVALSVRYLRVEDDAMVLSKLKHTTACHCSSDIFFSEFCFPLLSLFTEQWAKSSSSFPAVVFLLCTALLTRVLTCVTMLVVQSKAGRYLNTMCEYLSL